MKKIDGTIASPKGFHADGLHCGLKRKKKDIGWIVSDVPAQAAAVFTTNAVQAAPIWITKEALTEEHLQAVVVNSGNANACTGAKGLTDARQMQLLAAGRLGLAVNSVAIASTGVIGKELPMTILEQGIAQLSKDEGDAAAFHEAIMTTDTCTKEMVLEANIDGKVVTMAGVAKGSGMIHPNMATMLGFITTDAAISKTLLQKLLRELTDVTFNQITVDGDTSTNDMVLVLANGASGLPLITEESDAYPLFKEMLHHVMEGLAMRIAQDGEGATKLIEATVRNGSQADMARMIAKKIVGSSLVKTAMFGEDPNWGRIICAIGYADPSVNPDNIDITIEGHPVLLGSQPQSFDEAIMKAALAQETVAIDVDLHQGVATGKAWGCDLTYKYVEINALYHT